MKNKKVLLCITGGIAAYKAAALTSKLVQQGAEVRVLMTHAATQFISPLTLQSLSKNHVYTDVFNEKDPTIIAHVQLADWADVMVVAPATANIIAKFANGIADDMVSSTFLAVTAPIFIAPAMNVHMYRNLATQHNLQTLNTRGCHFIEPGEGMLACGYEAKGRMEEPENIITRLQDFFAKKDLLKGKKVLVTAGPTREKIDPVRFITNYSTGKMGYAIAKEAANMGADVTLVSGPTLLADPENITVVRVETADEMYQAVMALYSNTDIVIKTAAVADYRPKVIASHKTKKQDGNMAIELERTKDILKELGEKKEHQFLVGFAAETQNIEAYAQKKLQDKNLDMIVANNILDPHAGFGTDTNIVTIYKKDGQSLALPVLSKKEVAIKLLEEILIVL